MAKIEKSIEISAPLDKVFSLISWYRVPEYYDSIKKVEWISKPKMEVGATVHVLSEIAALSGNFVYSSPAYDNRALYIDSCDNNLYAFADSQQCFLSKL